MLKISNELKLKKKSSIAFFKLRLKSYKKSKKGTSEQLKKKCNLFLIRIFSLFYFKIQKIGLINLN